MHDHSHQHHPPPGDPRGRRALRASLALNGAFTVLQGAVGLAVGSMALVADAGHNLSDVAALTIALWAARLVDKPATARRTYGYRRAEVLAALANALTVVLVAGLIAVEAVRRLGDPPQVPGLTVALVAAVGIVVNAGSVVIIRRASAGHDLNLKAAMVHLAADALASAGVLVSGLLIWWRGWTLADPLVAVLIAALVVAASWRVLRDSLAVLLESAPPDVDPDDVGSAIAGRAGVVGVHDLHVWSLSSDFPALSAHVLVTASTDCHVERREIAAMLESRYGISHTTLQMEHAPGRLIVPGAASSTECHSVGCGGGFSADQS